VLYVIFTSCAAWFGSKSESKSKSFRDWMPSDWEDDSTSKPESKQKLTIQQQLDIVAQAFGARRK
jgi:hypothetical protein